MDELRARVDRAEKRITTLLDVIAKLDQRVAELETQQRTTLQRCESLLNDLSKRLSGSSK